MIIRIARAICTRVSNVSCVQALERSKSYSQWWKMSPPKETWKFTLFARFLSRRINQVKADMRWMSMNSFSKVMCLCMGFFGGEKEGKSVFGGIKKKYNVHCTKNMLFTSSRYIFFPFVTLPFVPPLLLHHSEWALLQPQFLFSF